MFYCCHCHHFLNNKIGDSSYREGFTRSRLAICEEGADTSCPDPRDQFLGSFPIDGLYMRIGVIYSIKSKFVFLYSQLVSNGVPVYENNKSDEQSNRGCH
jgi:hypothetical protein